MLISLLLSLCFTQAGDGSAITPAPREHEWWRERVEQIQEVIETSGKNTNVIFVGDSITQGWEGSGKRVWDQDIEKLGAVNLGIGGDRTEHVLWRLDNGHLEGIIPKVAVVMIGTNNFGNGQDSMGEVYDGIVAVVKKLTDTIPEVHVMLLDIFPRGESFNDMRGEILQVNQALQATYSDVDNVMFFPIGSTFLEDDGTISKDIMPDSLHLSQEGYQRWSDALVPTIAILLGRATGVNQPPVLQPSSTQLYKPILDQSGPWDDDDEVCQVKPQGRSTSDASDLRASTPIIK